MKSCPATNTHRHGLDAYKWKSFIEQIGPDHSIQRCFLDKNGKPQVATIPINIRNNTKMKSHIHACFIVRVFTL